MLFDLNDSDSDMDDAVAPAQAPAAPAPAPPAAQPLPTPQQQAPPQQAPPTAPKPAPSGSSSTAMRVTVTVPHTHVPGEPMFVRYKGVLHHVSVPASVVAGTTVNLKFERRQQQPAPTPPQLPPLNTTPQMPSGHRMPLDPPLPPLSTTPRGPQLVSCSFCGFSCVTAQGLVKHETFCAPRTDEERQKFRTKRGAQAGQRYPCQVAGCGKVYGSTSSRREHMRMCHPELCTTPAPQLHERSHQPSPISPTQEPPPPLPPQSAWSSLVEWPTAAHAPPSQLTPSPLVPSAPFAPFAPPAADDWACCDKCGRWRKLPLGTVPPREDKAWFCEMNPDMAHNTCEAAEEEVLEEPAYAPAPPPTDQVEEMGMASAPPPPEETQGASAGPRSPKRRRTEGGRIQLLGSSDDDSEDSEGDEVSESGVVGGPGAGGVGAPAAFDRVLLRLRR
jgi:hypothetical protein